MVLWVQPLMFRLVKLMLVASACKPTSVMLCWVHLLMFRLVKLALPARACKPASVMAR